MENKNKFAKNIFTENLINNNINTKNDQKNQKIISKINKILSKDYIDLK